MNSSLTIALVFLTYNEIDGVKALLPQLPDALTLGVDEMFSVDGGSNDGTREEFAKYHIPIHPQNSKGRGAAMRLAAARTQCTHMIFFSPDGNEDWRDISKFRGYFDQGYDLVIASRMMSGARNEEDDRLLRWRKWANNAFNLAANLLFRKEGTFITDTINGFRGLKREILEELDIQATGYTVEYQMSIRAMKHRKKIIEFPTQEGKRIGGETKAPSILTGIQFLRCVGEEIKRSSFFKAAS